MGSSLEDYRAGRFSWLMTFYANRDNRSGFEGSCMGKGISVRMFAHSCFSESAAVPATRMLSELYTDLAAESFKLCISRFGHKHNVNK